jgi:SAM-dependent methyltransferase
VFLRIAAARGAEVHGLDASDSLLRVARTRVPQADLRVGDMQSLPWPDDSFDIVAGFNSFFYAADITAALREAGRVAKPGSPVLIQVWGRPDRCDLESLKRTVASFLPKSDAPPKLWEPGVLEAIAEKAGLTPEDRFESNWAFQFPDTHTLLQRQMAPGVVVKAVNVAGEEAVRTAIADALAPYRKADGSYSLSNEWHYLIARAR